MADAAREHKVATQMGNQGQASEQVRLLCETIWDGAIGQVREVHVWTDRPLNGINNVYWPQGVDRPTDTPPVPETLDWDLWLGPAPQRPYHPAYLPFKWRGWWDFGTGALGDIGCHALDPVFRALKLGHPLSVEACCTLVNNETYPVASRITYEFPARGDLAPVTLHWYDGGMKPPRPQELEEGRRVGHQRRTVCRREREDLRRPPDPGIPAKRVRHAAADAGAFARPSPGMDLGLPGRQTRWFELPRSRRSAGPGGSVGQRRPATGPQGKAHQHEVVLGSAWPSRSRTCRRPISICTGSTVRAGPCSQARKKYRSSALGRGFHETAD